MLTLSSFLRIPPYCPKKLGQIKERTREKRRENENEGIYRPFFFLFPSQYTRSSSCAVNSAGFAGGILTDKKDQTRKRKNEQWTPLYVCVYAMHSIAYYILERLRQLTKTLRNNALSGRIFHKILNFVFILHFKFLTSQNKLLSLAIQISIFSTRKNSRIARRIFN